jgi:hypothetical protein
MSCRMSESMAATMSSLPTSPRRGCSSDRTSDTKDSYATPARTATQRGERQWLDMWA